MQTYKAIIKSGPMLEIKYYKSIRPRNKKNVARSLKKALTSEKQALGNKLRAQQSTQRLILCNFKKGDWWCRFSAPYQNFTEQEFEKAVSNFFKRVKYHAKKKGIAFKYIGFCECGKSGGNWHLHIIIEDSIREIAAKCWRWDNGMNFTPLYDSGNYEDLAKYIRKDVSGTKRLKTSRNLKKPEIEIKENVKREYKRIERGEMIKIPEGYYLAEDSFFCSDITGAKYNFVFLKLEPKFCRRKNMTIDSVNKSRTEEQE